MLSFLNRAGDVYGAVCYLGGAVPRAEEFGFLLKRGLTVKKHRDDPDRRWALRLAHPAWGEADLLAPKEIGPLDRDLIAMSVGIGESERAAFEGAGCLLTVRLRGRSGNLLRDRKNLLYFFRTILDDDGVGAIDWQALRLWSRAGIIEETDHDADLDVSQIFAVHALAPDDADPTSDEPMVSPWIHTHGLAEVGGFDFDFLHAVPRLMLQIAPSLALRILEGDVKPGDRTELFRPGGECHLVQEAQFHASAAEEHAALRDPREGHDGARVVVCDAPKKTLGLFGSKRPRPLAALATEQEGIVVHYSHAAGYLMSQRARLTLGMLRQFKQEFGDLPHQILMKIGIPIDGAGEEGEREFIWFKVESIGEDGVQAVCLNRPFNVSELSEGQRCFQPFERLADWLLSTPAGNMSPADLKLLRIFRTNDEIPRILRKAAAVGEFSAE